MRPANNAALAWGQLFRLSLCPTALADILAGSALAAAATGELELEPLLFCSTLGIYHGSMALNDWADQKEDARDRPHRPLPSAEITSRAALTAACGMILAGVSCAFFLNPALGVWMLGIATLAVGYNIWLRGPWSGPISLGACRAMHISAPAVLFATPLIETTSVIALGYGLYVFTLSRLARLETLGSSELKQAPSFYLMGCAAIFLATSVNISGEASLAPRLAATLLSLGAAVALTRRAWPLEPWTAVRVQGSVGLSLRLLLLFTASATLSTGSESAWIPAALILTGYPLAHALRKAIPPT